MSMTRMYQLKDALKNLYDDKYIVAVDENNQEYLIDVIYHEKVESDDDKDWMYAFRLIKSECGAIKR